MKKVNLNKMENLKEKLAVGYKNPPKEHQFKKGQSGNPAGRKPKPKPVSLMEAVKLELTKLVDITEDGKVIKVPFYSVLAKRIVADAVKNDKASRKLIMEYLAKEDLQLSKKVLEEREADKNKEDLIPEENRRAIVNMLNQYYMELVEAEERENGDLGSP